MLPADLATASGAAALLDQLAARGLEIGTLVNNAGFGAIGSFVDLGEAEQLEMVQLNVISLAQLTRRLLPGMVARGRGHVLNVASVAGFQPGPWMTIYSATKAFVVSFSEAIGRELRGTGVTVTTLCPGPTATPFVARARMSTTLLLPHRERHGGRRGGRCRRARDRPRRYGRAGLREQVLNPVTAGVTARAGALAHQPAQSRARPEPGCFGTAVCLAFAHSQGRIRTPKTGSTLERD